MPKPFWETEQDLTDQEQERIKVNEDFQSRNPDGAARSIESAEQIQFNPQLEETLRERARSIQEIGNDPDKQDKFEDDVFVSFDRAFQAVKASALRGMGAATSTKGVESPVRWGIARVDDFAKTIKAGDPDDAEFVSDNDLLPNGHPKASRNGEQPFIEGIPKPKKQDQILNDLK